MDVSVSNTSFILLSIVDVFKSFIWTDRYQGYGEFELYLPMNSYILTYIKSDYYITIADSDSTMIVEEFTLTTDKEEGNYIKIAGRSLESILYRRIVWGKKIVSGNLQDKLFEVINESIINPSISDRKISNFIFEYSTDPEITALTLEAQYDGDYIYDVIYNACFYYNIGFSVKLNSDNIFVCSLYSGKDRSEDQDILPYVTFSPNFDNLFDSNYYESSMNSKNVALVVGSGEDPTRSKVVVGSGSDLSRRELYVDASDISTTDENGATISQTTIDSLLTTRGTEQLSENSMIVAFDGEAEMSNLYKYGVDFSLGDIIQIENEYGLTGTSRITEISFAQDDTGYTVLPVFSTLS